MFQRVWAAFTFSWAVVWVKGGRWWDIFGALWVRFELAVSVIGMFKVEGWR